MYVDLYLLGNVSKIVLNRFIAMQTDIDGESYIVKADQLGSKYQSKAIIACRRAIQLQPQNFEAYYLMIYQLGLNDKAEGSVKAYRYDLIYKLNPNDIDPLLDKSECLVEIGKFKEALETLDRVIDIDPDSDRAYRAKGNTLMQLEDYEAAIQLFDKALQAETYPRAYYHYKKGLCFSKLGRYEEAIVSYTLAVEFIDPGVGLEEWITESYYQKVEALAKLEKWEECIQTCNEMITLYFHFDTNARNPYALKGDALYAQGSLKEALEAYNRCCYLSPSANERKMKILIALNQET